MSAKIAGVLGGMGPEATVDFMAKVLALTPAEKDQDHIRMLIDHNPGVPNRQRAILADGADPGPDLAAMAKRLEKAGADFLVIPCNTAYVFSDSITAVVTIPLISIIDVTIDALPDGCKRAGLLATDGCVKASVYQDGLGARGIDTLLPDDAQMVALMGLVGRIKGGETSADIGAGMQAIAETLVARGAEAIIAGCTEIPLVLGEAMLDVPLVASTDVLAGRTVQIARGERLGRITRHMLGLYAGQPGARAWRRYLSEHAYRSEAGPEIVIAALDLLPEAA